LDTSAWARTGTTGPTVGEALIKAGHKLRRADKNRIQGKIQIHEYLKIKENGRPRLQIFNTCQNLIRELQSIPLSTKNPEDVDKEDLALGVVQSSCCDSSQNPKDDEEDPALGVGHKPKASSWRGLS
jgi:hypothetical protein